jgi:hypothetical protein
MSQEKKKYKIRTNYMIYPSFQWVLISSNLLIILIISGFTYLQTYRSQVHLMNLGEKIKLPTNHPYFNFINHQYDTLYMYLVVGFLVGLLVSFIITLLLSHKFAGPLVRLKKYFQEMGSNGEVKPLTFRKGDYLEDLAPEINNALDKIRN